MAIRQVIQCSVCGKELSEEQAGDGFVGWGALQGIEMDGEANPTLCPDHLREIATLLDNIKTNFNYTGGNN